MVQWEIIITKTIITINFVWWLLGARHCAKHFACLSLVTVRLIHGHIYSKDRMRIQTQI